MKSIRLRVAVILNPSSASLKRLAWAFGTARKGSPEESELERILVERLTTCDQCKACPITCRCLGV